MRALRTFAQAMSFTKDIGSSASFDDDAAKLLWETLATLGEHSWLMETGVEYGRSTSLLAQAALDMGHRLVLVDPFLTYSGTPLAYAVQWLRGLGGPFTLHVKPTIDLLPSELPPRLDLLHVDGDHSTAGVETDCNLLLPLVRFGGFACFHDFGREGLPEVWPVVERWMRRGWQHVGTAGTLGVWRRT